MLGILQIQKKAENLIKARAVSWPSEAGLHSSQTGNIDSRLQELLASIIDVGNQTLPLDVNMGALGVESLAAAELADALQSAFNIHSDLSDIAGMTYGELRQALEAMSDGEPLNGMSPNPDASHDDGSDEHTAGSTPAVYQSHSMTADTPSSENMAHDLESQLSDPIAMLAKCASSFDLFARIRDFSDY